MSYDFWQRALAGETQDIHEGHAHPGFYRIRFRDKKTGAVSYKPCAYWLDGDKIKCRVGDKDLDELTALEQWKWAATNPITEEVYRAVAECGEPWPDVDPSIGHNSGALPDGPEALLEQARSAAEAAQAYGKISDETVLKQSQSLRSRLLEIAGAAAKSRKELNDPLAAQKKINDDTWKPIEEIAEGAAGRLKALNDNYLTEKNNEYREAQKQAALVGKPMPEAPPAQVKGGYGRAASAKPTWELDQITDFDACLQFFKGSQAIKEAVEKLAKAAAKKGDVPGCTRKEVVRTR
jgi:hypothetical protein